MSAEILKTVAAAEAGVKELMIDAQAKAAEILQKAELDGKAALESAVEKAKAEAARILSDAAGKAETEADAELKNAEAACAEIEKKAADRLAGAAEFIAKSLVSEG